MKGFDEEGEGRTAGDGGASSSGGATSIFGVLGDVPATTPASNAVSREYSLLQEPRTTEKPFVTDAFARAPQVAPPPAAPAAPVGSTEFTQLLRLMSQPSPGASMGDGMPFSQVAPMAAPIAYGSSTAPAAQQPVSGSFTDMFETVGPAASVSPAPLAAKAEERMEAGSAAASFTQVFAALEGQPLPVARQPAPATATATFDTRASAPAPVRPADYSDNAMSSLTQLLQAFDEPAVVPPMRSAAPVFSAAPPASTPSVDSFTDIFQGLDAVPRSPTPSPIAPSGGAGSFTQLIVGGLSPQRDGDGQADSYPPIAPLGAGIHGVPPPRRFEDRTPVYSAASTHTPSPAAPFFSAPDPPHGGASEPVGGLTQLLRTLESPSAPVANPPFPAPAPPAPAGGSLTQVINAMNQPPVASPAPSYGGVMPSPAAEASGGATTAFRPPSAMAQQPLAPVAPAGPGEFTRIIQASSFRESAVKAGFAGQPAVAATPPPPASMPQMPAWQMPQTPQMPPAAMGYPMMPPTPGMQPMAMPQMAMPQMAMPQMQPPAMPAPPPVAAPSATSKYLPILLIIVIVLLVGILLAVILLLKH